ncbi:MAG TPA: nucleotidyltransferase family protein [Thermomicrobiales bacterium]|nr:nucleotidyltransferase family protein [Thermomicrobiales bacterium]
MARTTGGDAVGRDEVKAILESNRAELRRFHVKSLALFGSVARDEAVPGSDIDVLMEFDGPATFDMYMDLKFFLEDLLLMPIDLVMRSAVRPRLLPFIERDILYVA